MGGGRVAMTIHSSSGGVRFPTVPVPYRRCDIARSHTLIMATAALGVNSVWVTTDAGKEVGSA
jgi:hypothetical protein